MVMVVVAVVSVVVVVSGGAVGDEVENPLSLCRKVPCVVILDL